MLLHQDNNVFSQFIKETAKSMKTEAFYIEKDYYVVMMLKNIASSNMRDYFSFKGGTSLSKAFGIIKRFSEDVDIRVFQPSGEAFGGGVAKRLYKSIESLIPNDALKSMNHINNGTSVREQRFIFDKMNDNPTDEISPYVKLEQNYQSSFSPIYEKEIESYVGQYLKNQNFELYEASNLHPFTVPSLCPKVTFAEKIGALEDYYNKGLHSNNDFTKLLSGIRHFYDLHMLLNDSYLDGYLESDEFVKYVEQKRENDFNKFVKPHLDRGQSEITNHFGYLINKKICESEIFTESFWKNNEIIKALEKAYYGDFKKIVFGEMPEFTEIMESFSRISMAIQDRFSTITTSIDLEDYLAQPTDPAPKPTPSDLAL
jgi:hypothetical protein